MTAVDDIELLVRSMTWEASDIVSLRLERLGGGMLPSWEPGAHIEVVVDGVGPRQYSLTGDPDDPFWTVAILKVQDGRGGSAAIHQGLRPGAVVVARGPRNHFALTMAPSYLFIAGGIGITPILPMARAAQTAGHDWTLHYGGRTRASMAFVDGLPQAPDRTFVTTDDESGPIDIARVIAQASPDTVIYCCGPEGLLDAATRVAAEHGRQLVIERFRPVQPVQSADDGAGQGTFEVELRRSGLTLDVPPDRSIVDVVEAAGLAPMVSCLEGVCGTCETPVLEGSVDHRDSILTPDEREANDTMMICVSRAACPRLVLDL